MLSLILTPWNILYTWTKRGLEHLDQDEIYTGANVGQFNIQRFLSRLRSRKETVEKFNFRSRIKEDGDKQNFALSSFCLETYRTVSINSLIIDTFVLTIDVEFCCLATQSSILQWLFVSSLT